MKIIDYILKTSISNNYNNKHSETFDLFNKLSDKFGYKNVVKRTYNINKELNIPSSLEMYIKRVQTTLFDQKLRFLEWDKETKSSYYFNNSGEIFKTDYKNGLSNDIPKYISERYNNLMFFIKNNDIDDHYEIEYVLIGYNDKHNFFLGNDNKHYYTLKNDYNMFYECTDKLNIQFNDFISQINQ